ncbi:MAG: serine hydrolase domain-containing protein [Vicinamibacteraceae bacterium]
MTTRVLATLATAAVALVSVSCARAGSDTSATAQSGSPCFAKSFRTRIERGLAGYADVVDIPGISYGIVRGDSLVMSGAIGYADRSARRIATADTPYNIASLTKVFTATLALMFVEDGVMDLDAPVSKYLPDSVRVPRDARGGAITLRSLLTHTSGLPSSPPNRRNQKVDGALDPGIWEAYSISDLYEALATTKLQSHVGTQFQYSNYGFALIGHLVERVAGRPYEQVLRERLLAPLGMPSTAISLSPAQEQQLAAFYWADDTTRTEQRAHARFGEVAGFIGLTSTVRDLARFVEAHLDTLDRTINPVPRTVATHMRQPRRALPADATSTHDIGFAWFLVTPKRTTGAQTIVTHSGEVDGHTSGLFLNPAEKIGVVLLQNLGGDDGTAAIDHLGFWLTDLAVAEQHACQS